MCFLLLFSYFYLLYIFLFNEEIIHEKGEDNTALKVVLPVALSLFWLLVLVAVTCYTKRYLTEKFRNATVEPEVTPETAKNGLTNHNSVF